MIGKQRDLGQQLLDQDAALRISRGVPHGRRVQLRQNRGHVLEAPRHVVQLAFLRLE
jgi:hypothetical protein